MKNKHVTNKGNSQSVSNCFKLSIKINTCNTATLFPLAMLTQYNFYCSMKLCFETTSRSYCSISFRHFFFLLLLLLEAHFSDSMTIATHFIDVIET